MRAGNGASFPGANTGGQPEQPAPARNTQYVYLGIRGKFEPEEVSSFLGLVPTKTRRQSEGRTPASREWAIWNFQTQAAEDVPIENQLKTLIATLLPKKELISTLAKIHSIRIQIVSDFGPEGYPGIFFSEEIVRGLGCLGLAIDLDLYGWKESNSSEP